MLTKSFMRVVVDVLSRAPIADPVRPIKLRVDIVADDLDVSTKTVSRALNILRKNGWLRRSSDHDGRNNWGEFCSGEFILGDGLRAMLGLPTITTQHQAQHASDAVMSANEGSACHSSQAATSAGFTPSPVLAAPVPGYAASTDDAAVPDWAKAKAEAGETTECKENAQTGTKSIAPATLIAGFNTSESLQEFAPCPVDKPALETKMSDGLYRVNKVFKKEASFKKDAFSFTPENQPQAKQPNHGQQTLPRIPADLLPLQADLGIHPFGICKLMALAKAANQRLQDVWIAKRDQILNAQAREGRAVRYFEFLLQCGEDFSYVAKQKLAGHTKPARSKKPGQAQATATTAAGQTAKPSQAGGIDHRIYWNKKFWGEQGVRISVHGDGSGEITDMRRTNAYIMPADMAPIYQAIEAGKLWLLEE